MTRTICIGIAMLARVLTAGNAAAQSFEADVAPLVESSCLQCHGDRTVTPLNLAQLGSDLTDPETFRAWAKVYERVDTGEMPPATAPRPDPAVATAALASLERAVTNANLDARGEQRTPLRRLTRLEYRYTISDLLGLDDTVAADLEAMLPAEADSGGFDTVASNQSMSPLHVRSYLAAADAALDEALTAGPRPGAINHTIDYAQSRYLYGMEQAVGLGLGIVKRLDDAFVAYHDFGSTYTFHSVTEGFQVPTPGRYRVTVEAYPHEAFSPVGLMVYRGVMAGVAASLDDLIGSFDIVGDEPQRLETTTYLRPGNLIGLSPVDLDFPDEIPPDAFLGPDDPSQGFGGMVGWPGEGVAIKSLTFEGPLLEDDVWPSPGTRRLLTGVAFDAAGEIELTKDPYDHIVDIVADFAQRAFRRPLADGELEAYASLARPILDDGRPFLEAVRVPLRAILSAPPFLYHGGAPGELDDHALATRLSYFLWRSVLDDRLFDAATEGRLRDPAVLAAEVDRMLDDPKSARMVGDFAGQAFRLYELRATQPDPGLYPEYDDRLMQAMGRETELFLAELIRDDLGIGQLIDADFSFINRRLAEHYGIEGVAGQQMRKVTLPDDSVRGGLLTQASVLKVTANGTTTSPVPRGNFVLTNLLGEPSSPPPPGIPGLEPDTRGTTTIREQLDAHRNNAVCASCHRTIDPPGFALESFDPIGGYRDHYRVPGGVTEIAGFEVPNPYTEGAAVDASGVTPAGDAFAGIGEYKQLLLDHEVDQVARHITSQLLVFGTGAEVEFADRAAVERILTDTRAAGYPVRTLIHEVVRSDLFRSR